jgi:hypothetical protein
LHEFYELAELQAEAEVSPQPVAKLPSKAKTRKPAKQNQPKKGRRK